MDAMYVLTMSYHNDGSYEDYRDNYGQFYGIFTSKDKAISAVNDIYKFETEERYRNRSKWEDPVTFTELSMSKNSHGVIRICWRKDENEYSGKYDITFEIKEAPVDKLDPGITESFIRR